MKYFILLSFLISFVLKTNAQSPAQLLVEQSIRFHDPKNNWHKLKANLTVNSIVDRNGKIDTSERQIFFDLKKNIFNMEYTQDNMKIELHLDSDECFGRVKNQPRLNKEKLTKLNISCDRAKMYNSYFRYLIGMPMKLKDSGTIIHDEILQKNYKGNAYDVVTVTYEPSVGTYTWLFYFDKETKELMLTEFSKDGSFQNGETIELNNKIKYQKILLPGQLMWYVLPDRPFLAEENIVYSKPGK